MANQAGDVARRARVEVGRVRGPVPLLQELGAEAARRDVHGRVVRRSLGPRVSWNKQSGQFILLQQKLWSICLSM